MVQLFLCLMIKIIIGKGVGCFDKLTCAKYKTEFILLLTKKNNIYLKICFSFYRADTNLLGRHIGLPLRVLYTIFSIL